MRRNNFSLQRRHAVSQPLPDQLSKISSFILHVRRLRHRHQYSFSAIGNMDEIPLWQDMPGDTTATQTTGEQSLSVRTNKGRFTVILAAKADGTKLKPFVVFKEVRPVPRLTKVPGVVVCMRRNGGMNEELTVKWIDSVWGQLHSNRRLLVWDAFR